MKRKKDGARVATSELTRVRLLAYGAYSRRAAKKLVVVVVVVSITGIHMRLLSRPKTALLPQSHSTSHLFLHEICSEKYAPYHRSMVLIPDHTTSPGRSAAACPPPSCAN